MLAIPSALLLVLGVGSASAAMTFVHPGTLESKAELDYVKTQLAAGAQPYAFEFQTMRYNEGGLATPPAPQTTINANSGAADAARDDARRAYGNALAWYLTGTESYATQAVAYLNAWSGLQSITATNDQNKLVAGWLGSLWGPAADLMLTYPGWAASDVANFRAMFRRAFYPVLNTASTWNGNVDLHQISAIMAISIFNEDETEFNLGVTRLAARMPAYFYLETDGTPQDIAGSNGNLNGFWSNPTDWVDGLTQETCRDNNHHAQFAMSGALGAMESAWHQGVDLYTTYQSRMVPAMELMGLQSFSGSMQGTCANNQTSGDVYDTWEIGYNHYHVRKGIDMPNTWSMINGKVRSYASNPGSWNIFYESLTHADIPAQEQTVHAISPRPSSETPAALVLLGNGMAQLTASSSNTYTITTQTLDGSALARSSFRLEAGHSQMVHLGIESAPPGIYLVQVLSSQGATSLKLTK